MKLLVRAQQDDRDRIVEQKKVIAIDLDGTLAYYDYHRGPSHIGEPIPSMLEFVKKLIAEGHEIRIFTARVSVEKEAPIARQAIEHWLKQHGLPKLEITCIKKYDIAEFYDDRAIGVIKNTGILLKNP